MTVATFLSILSALLTVARWMVGYAEQQKWMTAGAAEATLKGIQDADAAIKKANQARAASRDSSTRDPDSILRDDDGFKRPD